MSNKKVSGTKKVMEGALAGAVLGVAAGLFITSKKGKEVQKDVKKHIADFYKSVSPKIKKVKKMTEEDFKKFMEESVVKYGKAKKMTEEEVKDLSKEVKAGWKHLAKHF
ncbi:TPA: hypothetical protein DCZ46_03375 [Candidatus Campbellbacteria bacterium]|jgi:gas vesicle protein|uniref:Gas vesicle protein n=2 Tax=Candidatus Campbelliibacteriota TaxID=1752727 RepID=A0A1F5EN74_9BACT|nr:MAG: protein of unknown function with transmembrane region [Candidatus Campbellbacteria bacterium GW2011_OD1_34_28]KKP74830.1 MAG: hypothetical protein UR74_C0002G0096 [Candidatus Campbellbacteria bacterium GW2011_GWD2_35_24]KKP75716.1 MAG: hypothetical protein UR75_C0002G0097 [Candidatus Campbellbacteria bacterium GW2011_GWC2_35_28]KKP77036.1 MAG: hypothetical protein UR76_C0002G0237 [Candidatus Campbellbacteria bacterium GW2011_GWC1_35_31]KKP78962.1 MAG: hypothetical protein UR79_C0002G023